MRFHLNELVSSANSKALSQHVSIGAIVPIYSGSGVGPEHTSRALKLLALTGSQMRLSVSSHRAAVHRAKRAMLTNEHLFTVFGFGAY